MKVNDIDLNDVNSIAQVDWVGYNQYGNDIWKPKPIEQNSYDSIISDYNSLPQESPIKQTKTYILHKQEPIE